MKAKLERVGGAVALWTGQEISLSSRMLECVCSVKGGVMFHNKPLIPGST